MTQTITALIVALQGIDPTALITLTLPGAVTMILAASDLDAALGVHIAKVLYVAHTSTAVNLRDKATVAGHLMRTMPPNTPLDVYTPANAAIPADGHLWVYARTWDGAFGWCAADYLVDGAGKPIIAPVIVVPPPVTPAPTVTRHRFGVHFLQDAATAISWVGTHKIAAATVVDNHGLANTLIADGVPYVLARVCGIPNGDAFRVPDDSAAAAAYGTQLFNDRFGAFMYLDVRGYIQLLCEGLWTPGHNAFWLAAMQAAEDKGRKLAICGYAVGGPEPEQWATMIPALQHAKAHGHIVALHEYTAQNTPAGQLSAANLEQYYELRFVRFYDAVPADARPPLVISEFGNWDAVENGATNEIALCKLFEAAIKDRPEVVGYCYWTAGGAGGWGKSDITKDLDAYAQWLAT
jgi:hypothetical protein